MRETATITRRALAEFRSQIFVPTPAGCACAAMSDKPAQWIGGKEIALPHNALPVCSPFPSQSRFGLSPMVLRIALLAVRPPLMDIAGGFRSALSVAFHFPIGENSTSYVVCRRPHFRV